MTRTLRSSPIAGPSSLLRTGPPLCSATGTLPLTVLPLGGLPLATRALLRPERSQFRNDRFPSSAWTPEPGSRHLYAGHHLGSKQVSPRLIPGECCAPGFDVICEPFDMSSVDRFRSPSRLLPDELVARLFRNAQHERLLTAAPCGGLQPPPCRAAARGLPSSSIQHRLRPPAPSSRLGVLGATAPRLLTGAPHGGLRPPPTGRPRRPTGPRWAGPSISDAAPHLSPASYNQTSSCVRGTHVRQYFRPARPPDADRVTLDSSSMRRAGSHKSTLAQVLRESRSGSVAG